MSACAASKSFVIIHLRFNTKDKQVACLIRIFDRSSGRPSHESNNHTIRILIAVPIFRDGGEGAPIESDH
jgi:hypothetical protein